MDREKKEFTFDVPEAEILDYWEEESEYIIYNNLDRIKDWLKKILKKIWRWRL